MIGITATNGRFRDICKICEILFGFGLHLGHSSSVYIYGNGVRALLICTRKEANSTAAS
jgi:hypothetical protein